MSGCIDWKMMSKDKELLKLCKEVHERTGWSGTLAFISEDEHKPNSTVVETVYEKYVGLYDNAVGCDECEGDYLKKLTPLYTSDYLLEKLPLKITVDGEKLWLSIYPLDSKSAWVAGYADDTPNSADQYGEWADGATAPLKALLKLVIALHDAGVKL